MIFTEVLQNQANNHWLNVSCQDLPLLPAKDILSIAANSQVRLVQDGNQLLDVLIESLKRLEAKLQGETPTSQFLWDRVNKNTYKPKDENSLSDFIKNHLDDDIRQKGVVVNREVQIHRGERTDIHVDALIQDPKTGAFDTISAIIEVKGCWNRELYQAMKTQLMDKYLKDNHCQYGLYLIGWFNCDYWDKKNDYRQQDAPDISIDKARIQFDNQSANLSQQGVQIRSLVIDATMK